MMNHEDASPSHDESKPKRQPERDEKGRFKPGFSGNYDGRPTKEPRPATSPSSLNDWIISIAEEIVEWTHDGKKRRGPAMWAMLLKLRAKALQGDEKSAKQFFEYYSKALIADDKVRLQIWEHILEMEARQREIDEEDMRKHRAQQESQQAEEAKRAAQQEQPANQEKK
jgi:hypothetical protein